MRATLAVRLLAYDRFSCAAALCVAVAVVGCSGVTSQPDSEPDVVLRLPSTDRERAAARQALRFAALVQREDAPGACDLARGAASQELRCSSEPRIPSWLLRISQRVQVKVVDVAEVPGAIRLGLGPPAPTLLAIEVDSAGRVVTVGHYGFG